MHSLILPIVAVVVVLIILAVLKKLPKGKGLDLPYEKVDALFTPSERSFLVVGRYSKQSWRLGSS